MEEVHRGGTHMMGSGEITMTSPSVESAHSIRARIWWWAWNGICVLTILNANSIAVLAGAPERIFTPLLLVVALSVVALATGELGVLRRQPLLAVLAFGLTFLWVGLFASTTDGGIGGSAALSKVPLYGASLLLVTCGAVAASRLARTQQLDRLLMSLFWPFVFAAVSGVAFVTIPAVGDVLDLLPGERLHGVFGNVNELGIQSGFSLVLGTVLSFRTRQRRWVVIGTLAAMTGAVSSFSKTALLSLLPLIVFQVYAWNGARLRVRTVLVILITGAVSAALVVILARGLLSGSLGIQLTTDQQMRLEVIANVVSSGALDEGATTGRTAIWARGLEEWQRSPVVGLGLSAFDRVRGIDIEIHNSVLRVLGESGLIGFTAFLVMVAVVIRRVIRCREPAVHLLATGFLLVEFPAFLTGGGFLLARNHNILTGCVLGLLAVSATRTTSPEPVRA